MWPEEFSPGAFERAFLPWWTCCSGRPKRKVCRRTTMMVMRETSRDHPLYSCSTQSYELLYPSPRLSSVSLPLPPPRNHVFPSFLGQWSEGGRSEGTEGVGPPKLLHCIHREVRRGDWGIRGDLCDFGKQKKYDHCILFLPCMQSGTRRKKRKKKKKKKKEEEEEEEERRRRRDGMQARCATRRRGRRKGTNQEIGHKEEARAVHTRNRNKIHHWLGHGDTFCRKQPPSPSADRQVDKGEC